jgi:hypothetical protein
MGSRRYALALKRTNALAGSSSHDDLPCRSNAAGRFNFAAKGIELRQVTIAARLTSNVKQGREWRSAAESALGCPSELHEMRGHPCSVSSVPG